MDKYIYLDNNATTKVDPRVVESMISIYSSFYANPASTHKFGKDVNNFVIKAREQVASLINSSASDIVFTSGATESINLALRGYAFANQKKGKHLITVETEHKAVLDVCKYLETIGFEVTYLPVNKDGLIDLIELKNSIRKDTILISVMYVNNEIGVIQPIKEISEIAHYNDIVFFCDATQAVGKIDVDVEKLGIDLMAFSGHKFYGPKGVGGLFIKKLKKNNLKIEPILYGGGHEHNLRSGTLNAPGIVGLGVACEIAKNEMHVDANRISKLRDNLEEMLLKYPKSFVNGSTQNRIYNVTNICFPDVDANLLISKLENIAISNGSACTAAIVEPSHVLKSIGLDDDEALASIRFSLGRFTYNDEISLLRKRMMSLFKTAN
ncbi:MAG: cysteine desulfurase [Ignavibacteriaceae bacterium]|nr:cysteine desulfurase [Ignavibacteriaceae bacterium]